MEIQMTKIFNPRTGQADTIRPYQMTTNIPLQITESGEPYLIVPMGEPPAKVYMTIFIV